MKDAIIAVRTETRVSACATVRCGRCAGEFDTFAENRTARCPHCRRTCHLDTADRLPEAPSPNVIPIDRRRVG